MALDGDDVQDVEQYSPQSAARLREATEELTAALGRFTEETTGMHGGSAQVLALFGLVEAVASATVAWHARAFDHTGVSAMPLDEDATVFGPVDDDEQDEDVEGSAVVEGVSVVSRWDLAVVDTDALLAAGRAAHRRNRVEENDQDAAAAVNDPARALYALLHEQGEPCRQIPGVEVAYGARVYLQPDLDQTADADADADADGMDDLDEKFELLQTVLPPPGRVLFSEDWS
ncbi:hypothetical protein [uncultured Pseudokineococcus sp.]|uniref:hypothetical protein n=1 Tax=uncultured Pseudokineococcus sp. TaxID=1642928 RepID=UPI0026192A4C|nr:hypothetical protein [uncultured Pseudokineococcus sp.]